MAHKPTKPVKKKPKKKVKKKPTKPLTLREKMKARRKMLDDI